SLVPLLRASTALPRVVASEYGRSFALRADRWHWVVGYDGRGRLYDTSTDPEETTDQATAQPMWRRYLHEAAGLYLANRIAWRRGVRGAAAAAADRHARSTHRLPASRDRGPRGRRPRDLLQAHAQRRLRARGRVPR